MQLSIYSWDGNLINDTTNYVAWFGRGVNKMPSAYPTWAPRGMTFPKLAGKTIDGGMLSFVIECKGTFHSQAETLKKWFRVDDFTLRTLVVKDKADSDRQWYVKGYATEPVLLEDGGVSVFQITLALQEPLWRTVTAQSVAWAITASGQTKALNVLGNQNARPIISYTATSSKLGGYLSAKFVPVYSPMITASNNEPLDLTNGGWNTSALIQDNANKCLLNGALTNVATTITYDTITGTLPASGVIYVDTEQISYASKSGTQFLTCVRGINGTTAVSHLDNAVVYVSRMAADGRDLRVMIDGVETDRWITGINTTNTKVWVNQTSQTQVDLKLGAAIASSGAVPTVTVKNVNVATAQHLARLPATFLFVIGTEIFIGTGVTIGTTYTITSTARAVNGSSMAAHAIDDRIYWMEHQIFFVYENPSATVPVTDDTKKPMIDLTSSTNTSWVHTEFSNVTGSRTAAWHGQAQQDNAYSYKTSGIYTGSHGAFADPATEAGIMLNAWQANGVWMADTATRIMWYLSHPSGITNITVTGGKYRYTTEWPSFYMVGDSPTNIFTEATPSAAMTWEALSAHAAVAVPTWAGAYSRMLYLVCRGTISGGANNTAMIEMQSTTAVIDSANVMKFITISGNVVNFQVESTFTNSTTGEAFSISLSIELNKVLLIDCDKQTVTYNGVDLGVPLKWNSVRVPWLDIVPGANTITFTDLGTVPGLTANISWEDRNTI